MVKKFIIKFLENSNINFKLGEIGIARLNSDGSVDPSFNAAVTFSGPGKGYVNNCILLNPRDPDSQIIIAGPFTIASSSGTYYGLARLNSDGTVAGSFLMAPWIRTSNRC